MTVMSAIIEVEFMAITKSFKETKWLNGLIRGVMSYVGFTSMIVHCNNERAIILAKKKNEYFPQITSSPHIK